MVKFLGAPNIFRLLQISQNINGLKLFSFQSSSTIKSGHQFPIGAMPSVPGSKNNRDVSALAYSDEKRKEETKVLIPTLKSKDVSLHLYSGTSL